MTFAADWMSSIRLSFLFLFVTFVFVPFFSPHLLSFIFVVVVLDLLPVRPEMTCVADLTLKPNNTF